MYNLEIFKYELNLLSFMSEKSLFLDVVGYSPTMKVIEYLIEGREFDYTLTDLTNAGVSWGTLHTIFPRLIKHKIVIQTRTIGRANLYKINQNNPIVKNLTEIYGSIVLGALEKREKIIVKH